MGEKGNRSNPLSQLIEECYKREGYLVTRVRGRDKGVNGAMV